MKLKAVVGALVAAGVIGAGAAVWQGNVHSPVALAHADPAVTGPVAPSAANPVTSNLPLNGFTELVKRYGPAVVNITVEGTAKPTADEMPQMPQLDPNDPFYQFFRGFGMPQNTPIPMRGEGSGFIVSPNGYIVTNAHVVANADEVTVRLTDRREFKAKVIGSDKATDVAVIKIDATGLPTVKLGDSRKAQVGEWVVAIGSPFGFENSVTAGIISAKSRSLPDATYVPFLQTDVPVNPGNSGGPLFNLAGEVIGINSQIYTRTGGYEGLSFAVPIEVALHVEDQLIKHGKVTRGHLGVVVQEVNAPLASSFGLDRPRGALVASVDPSSPAEKAGMQVGDIILSYDGHPIDRSADLPLLVANTPPGQKAAVEVWRKGSDKTLTVATAAQKEQNVAENSAEPHNGRLGLAVRPLSPDERKELGKGGVVVEEVSGPAARAGVQPGDVVLSLNGNLVSSPQQLREQVSKAGKSAALLIERNDRQLFVPVELG